MRKYNKYGAGHKNITLYDIELVKTYNGTPVPPDTLVSKIIGKKESFHLLFIPNHETKEIRFGADVNTDFSNQVMDLMMQSGEAEHLMKQMHQVAFGDKQVEEVQLKLPQLDLPSLQYSLVSPE
jgi:hypothetical protein